MSTQHQSWLADAGVLLHIGVHKTGTTAVQGALALARPALRANDVVYPGPGVSQYLQSLGVLDARRGWKKGGMRVDPRRWQDEVVAETRAASTSKVVVSSEAICEATPEVARSIIEDLGGERVQVVVTLRPLEQLIPSTWQQYIKAGVSVPFDEWLRGVMIGPGQPPVVTPSFWKRNDHAAQVEKWAEIVGPERVAVVVVDARDRTGVFRSFEQLIGLPEGTLVENTNSPSNRSLSVPEVELIRHLNERIGKDMDWSQYNALMRQGGILRLVESRRPPADELRLTVPGWAVERAREIGAEAVERIRASGVHVVGDLDLLVPTDPIPADQPTTTEVVPVEVASLVLEAVLGAAGKQRARLEKAAKKAAGKPGAQKTKADAPATGRSHSPSARQQLGTFLRRRAPRVYEAVQKRRRR